MKKINAIILSAIILIGMATFIIMPKSDFSENENRLLQKFPELESEDVFDGDYTRDLTAYFSDHFPFRDTFINIKTSFEKNALNKKEINNIYICDDGYCIEKYNAPKNTDRIINTFKKFSENSDIKPDIMLVPTAIEVYRDKLPKYCQPISQLNEIDKIYSSVDANNIDVYDVLVSEKDNKELFYRLDHHWTTYGAYVGYKGYCQNKGIEPIAYEDLKVEKVADDFKGTIYSKLNDYSLKGDTIEAATNMPDLTVVYDNETTNSIYAPEYLEGKDKYSYFLNNINTFVEITNNDIETNRELVMAKDSYGNSMIPFLVNHYKRIYVFDPRSYKNSISQFVNTHSNVTDVLILYNMNTIDQDTGVNVIY